MQNKQALLIYARLEKRESPSTCTPQQESRVSRYIAENQRQREGRTCEHRTKELTARNVRRMVGAYNSVGKSVNREDEQSRGGFFCLCNCNDSCDTGLNVIGFVHTIYLANCDTRRSQLALVIALRTTEGKINRRAVFG